MTHDKEKLLPHGTIDYVRDPAETGTEGLCDRLQVTVGFCLQHEAYYWHDGDEEAIVNCYQDHAAFQWSLSRFLSDLVRDMVNV